MTLSTPVKIVALAGLALALGLAGVALLLKGHHAGSPTADAPVVAPPPVRHTAAAAKPAPKPKPRVHILPGTPPIVGAALLRKPIVVVVTYDGRVATDRGVVLEAYAGAREAHAGFLALNVANNSVAAGVATWSNSVVDPVVAVVKRPGNIVFNVAGVTDREAVAQAVTNAR